MLLLYAIFALQVAILFLLDVDNAVFAYCLPEAVRSEAEATGRAVIGDTERHLLAFSKHILARLGDQHGPENSNAAEPSSKMWLTP